MDDNRQDETSFPDPVVIEIVIVYSRFSIGMLVATPAALDALKASNESPYKFLTKHPTGNYEELYQYD